MDRRRFIGAVAGNLLATPIGAWSQTAGIRPTKPSRLGLKSATGLAPNTARNVGPYLSQEAGGANITDYSGITFDRIGHRMCLFGGGHGPSQETDIRVFDMTT